MSAVTISGSGAPAASQPMIGPYSSRFAVAGINVEISADTPEAADLGPQLMPFATSDDPCDIEVRVEWSACLAPVRSNELFHSGCLWKVQDSGDGFLFDFATERLGRHPYKRMRVDENFQRAQVILNRECLTAADAGRALEYPLDELLITHHLSLGRGVELHACGLVGGNESFLFAGHSGAGKSTTTRLWKQHAAVGVLSEVLSDDRIILRKQDGHFFMHGTPWHGDAAFASSGCAPIQRIFLLEHGSENRVERLSPSAAAGELLARSFVPFYQHRFVNPVLGFLEEVVASVPCYRFHFVPDRPAVEMMIGFRD